MQIQYWQVSTLFVLLKRKDKNKSPSYLMTLHVDKLTNEDKETKQKKKTTKCVSTLSVQTISDFA